MARPSNWYYRLRRLNRDVEDKSKHIKMKDVNERAFKLAFDPRGAYIELKRGANIVLALKKLNLSSQLELKVIQTAYNLADTNNPYGLVESLERLLTQSKKSTEALLELQRLTGTDTTEAALKKVRDCLS